MTVVSTLPTQGTRQPVPAPRRPRQLGIVLARALAATLAVGGCAATDLPPAVTPAAPVALKGNPATPIPVTHELPDKGDRPVGPGLAALSEEQRLRVAVQRPVPATPPERPGYRPIWPWRPSGVGARSSDRCAPYRCQWIQSSVT